MTRMVELRRAGPADIAAVAALFDRSTSQALPFLAKLHTLDEDRAHFAGFLDTGRITLAEDDEGLLGFVVETDGHIHHLYLDPPARRRGVGTLLLADVKTRQRRIDLWCFAQNLAGLAFYAAQGFVERRRTEGDNEQGLPDVLLEWQR